MVLLSTYDYNDYFGAYLAFSKYGSIRLGKDGEKPKYNYPSWLSMLFGAGMGIGLLFYGIAEPISHFTDPLTGKAGQRKVPNSLCNIHFSTGVSFRGHYTQWSL